jgi:hypothetical protein
LTAAAASRTRLFVYAAQRIKIPSSLKVDPIHAGGLIDRKPYRGEKPMRSGTKTYRQGCRLSFAGNQRALASPRCRRIRAMTYRVASDIDGTPFMGMDRKALLPHLVCRWTLDPASRRLACTWAEPAERSQVVVALLPATHAPHFFGPLIN